MPDGFEQAAVVEPIHPFERGEFDGLEIAPGAGASDDLGFEETVDRLGESVVVTIPDAADRGLDARFDKALGVFDRDVLHAAVAVVDETTLDGAAIVDRLLQGVENESRVGRACDPPADAC
jgi:hypothetical protein